MYRAPQPAVPSTAFIPAAPGAEAKSNATPTAEISTSAVDGKTTRTVIRIHPAICARVLLLAGVHCVAAASDPHRFYLTRETSDGIPASQPRGDFSCDDTIYAVAEFNGLANGKHELLANWSDPRGKTRERTPLPFHVRQPRERVWVWLRLNRPSGSAAISFFDPAAGMSEFIGQWTVVLTLDGARLDTLRFKVLC